MKKITLALFLMLVTLSYSQKIVENKTDEFTKKIIVRTDWENLSGLNSLHFSTRISSIDDHGYLDIKIFTNSVASIDKEHDIFLMAEDGDILTLHSLKYVISGYGDGANGLIGSKVLGMYINCALTKDDIDFLKTKNIKKVRINTSEGYFEEELKIKRSVKLKDMTQLVFK